MIMMSARILIFVLIVAAPGIPSWVQQGGAGGALNSVAMNFLGTGIRGAAGQSGISATGSAAGEIGNVGGAMASGSQGVGSGIGSTTTGVASGIRRDPGRVV